MTTLDKQGILFIGLIIVAFILIFPEISFGVCITEPGQCASECGVITYKTQCGEEFEVGSCGTIACCCDEFGNCSGECLVCSADEEWSEYKCDSPDCDGDILVRRCWSFVDGGPCDDDSCECEDEKACVKCEPMEGEICEECQSWQKPIREHPCDATDQCQKWSRYRKPECLCDGKCLDAPSGDPRYYDHPLYPLDECNPETDHQMASSSVYLPVKLDWDDVKGWRDGWIEDGECYQVLDCQAGDKACYEENDDLAECKESRREDCYNKANALPFDEYWLAPFNILEFYREECLNECNADCRDKHKTNTQGCTKKCPNEEGGGGDHCYLEPEGYAQSYIIKIEGREESQMRNPEAQEKIDVLKALIDQEISTSKIIEYERQIEKIKEEELYIDSWIEALRQSEFLPPSPCFFKSNRTYNWQVRACCSVIEEVMSNEKFEELYGDLCPGIQEDKKEELKEQGVWVEDSLDEVCGPWSDEWEFVANSAPEPKLSYDPDWTGEGRMEDVSYEGSRRLEWCELSDELFYERTAWGAEMYYKPLGYKIFVYYWGKDEFVCHPDFITDEGECVPMLLNPEKAEVLTYEKGQIIPLEAFFDKHDAFFTKDTIYAWKLNACLDHVGYECGVFSQEWRFGTFPWTLTLKLDQPWSDKETPIGLPVSLQWLSSGANSYNYEISGVDSGKYYMESMELDHPQLSLDTVYTWKIQPCLDYKAEDCEDWGEEWYFRTTGRPPKSETMKPTGSNIPLPAEFEWENIPGAESYIFKIWGNGLDKEIVIDKETRPSLGYPDLKQEIDYSWQVTTCAHPNGEACNNDNPSPVQTFKTFKLAAPSNLEPVDGGIIYTYEPRYTISWKQVQGAEYYQYEATLNSADPKDPKEDCEEGKIIAEDITQKTSVDLPLECWGEYEWTVTPCLDENCYESGDESSSTFSFVAEEAPPETHGWGFIPCGRDTEDPTTPWRETDSCEIEDVFILIYIILNFFLWKVIPIILALLVLASGVIFYFSLQAGNPEPFATVKSLWKAVGIGLAIIFLAWTIISLFLMIFGYRAGLFGPWWQI